MQLSPFFTNFKILIQISYNYVKINIKRKCHRVYFIYKLSIGIYYIRWECTLYVTKPRCALSDKDIITQRTMINRLVTSINIYCIILFIHHYIVPLFKSIIEVSRVQSPCNEETEAQQRFLGPIKF